MSGHRIYYQRGGRYRKRRTRSRRRRQTGGGWMKRAIAKGKVMFRDPRWQSYLRTFAAHLEQRGDPDSKILRMLADGSRYAARFHKRYIAVPQYR